MRKTVITIDTTTVKAELIICVTREKNISKITVNIQMIMIMLMMTFDVNNNNNNGVFLWISDGAWS